MPRGYRGTFVAIGLIAAITSPCLGQEEQPQRNAEDQKARQEASENHKAEPGPEEQITVPIEASEADPSAEDAARDHQDSPQGDVVQPVWAWDGLVTTSDTFAQWIMALFGVVATGVSVYAVHLLKQTLKATREAIGEAEKGTKAARGAAAAAHEANKISTQAVETSERMGRIQVRAYLIIYDAKIRWPERQKPSIKITVKNSGQTPAGSVTVEARCGLFYSHGPVRKEYEFPYVVNFVEDIGADIDRSVELTIDNIPPQEVMDKFKRGAL